MKLSIVIPVYRVETMLDRCVRSVVSQNFEATEIILVDDGSPDTCPQLCDEWARRDSRIRVIHKQNGGLSDARNAGIDLATGEYITFVDSDDYLAPNTIVPLMQQLSADPDIDILEYPVADRFMPVQAVYQEMDTYWLETQAYTHTYAWNKLYRRTLFETIRFPQGKVFEDAYTLPKLLRKAHKVALTTVGTYHYISNPNGITATAGGQELAQLLEAHLGNGMPVDDHYFMHLLNIQMDVYELTGAVPSLPARRINTQQLRGIEKLKAITYNHLGIIYICKLNTLIHKLWRNH